MAIVVDEANNGVAVIVRAVIEVDAIAAGATVATDHARNKDAANKDVRNSRAANRAAATKVAAALIVRHKAHDPRNRSPPKRVRIAKPNRVLLSHVPLNHVALSHAALSHAALIRAVADVIAVVVPAGRAIRSVIPRVIPAGHKASATNHARRSRIRRAQLKRVVIVTTKMMISTICVRRFVRPIAPASQRSIRVKQHVNCGMTKFHPRAAASTSLESLTKKLVARRSSNGTTNLLTTNSSMMNLLAMNWSATSRESANHLPKVKWSQRAIARVVVVAVAADVRAAVLMEHRVQHHAPRRARVMNRSVLT